MTEKELVLTNYTERVAAGNMFLEIISRMTLGENIKELSFRLRKIKQLQRLFDYEAAKELSDLVLLSKCVLSIKILLGKFLKTETLELVDFAIAPEMPELITMQIEFGPDELNIFSIETGTINTVFTFDLPSTVTIQSIIDLDAGELDIISDYTAVSLGGGITRYIKTQAIPYLTNHTHQVTTDKWIQI